MVSFHILFDYFTLGEIVDCSVVKGVKTRLDFDMDSGISESSVTSELSKAGPSGLQRINIKQEQASPLKNECPAKITKKRRHKESSEKDESEEPVITKKIKMEPEIYEDHQETVLNVKKENTGSKEKYAPRLSFRKKFDSSANESFDKSGRPKKSKKRFQHDESDDFETSLQLLLAEQIKKEI